jgi:hypothetical protein
MPVLKKLTDLMASGESSDLVLRWSFSWRVVSTQPDFDGATVSFDSGTDRTISVRFQ